MQLLQSLGNMTRNEYGRDLTPDKLKAWLRGADAVVPSLGFPSLTAVALGEVNKLRLVGHAAGTIKHLIGDQLCDNGIGVLSAAPEIAHAVAEHVL